MRRFNLSIILLATVVCLLTSANRSIAQSSRAPTLTNQEEATLRRLRALLKDRTPLVRKRVAILICEMGPKAQSAIPDLEEALIDEDQDVRDAVASALEQVGEPQTLDDIIRVIGDQAENVYKRTRACARLAKQFPGSEGTKRALNSAVLDPNPKVREAAAKAIEARTSLVQAAQKLKPDLAGKTESGPSDVPPMPVIGPTYSSDNPYNGLDPAYSNDPNKRPR